MATKSPTALSLDRLRAHGYTVQVVEHWNSFAKKRYDLFGCIDILAIKKNETLGVQTTTRSNVSARRRKILEEPRMLVWLLAGNKLEVWGWGRLVKGTAWELKVIEIKEVDFVAEC